MADERPKIKLHPDSARSMTSREVSKIIGGLLGGIITSTSYEAVRDAVDWWSQNFEKAFPKVMFKESAGSSQEMPQ